MDVRTATCRKEKDTKAILDELEQGVGFAACNTQVIGLLREALVAQAWAALGRLPAAERGTSWQINNLGVLLKNMGKLEEARPLLEEALQARRETLGDRHPATLITIGNLAELLRATGALVEAEAVLGNTVGVAQEVFGSNHMHTLVITAKAARLQHAQPGGAAAGKELLAATVARMGEVLGEDHQHTSKYRKVLLVEME